MREQASIRLSKALEYQKVSQTELARLSGVSKSLISSYLSGRYKPTLDTIENFASILRVSPAWLAGFDVDMNENIPSYDKNSGILTIPFLNQKLSAGTGCNFLSSEDIEIKKIDILKSVARGVDKSSLVACEISGDSMIGEMINSGDIAIISKGMINGEGIYAINYGGDLMIKRLVFDRLTSKIDIISANPNYPIRTVDAENVGIIGKVIGLIHNMNF